MNFRLAVLSVVLLTCFASRHSKGPHKDKNNIVNRQQIFGRNNGNVPMLQVGDLIKQLKQQQQNSNLREVELSPSNADAINGLTGAGIGLPFGTLNSRIDKNPLIGANGLSKNSLEDIMFGNFKGLASVEGNSVGSSQPESVQSGDMRQMLGGQTNNLEQMNNGNVMGNILTNAQPISPMNLGPLAAANNMAGAQGLNGFSLNNGGLNGLSMSSGNLASLGLNGANPNLIGPPGAGMNGFPGGPMPVPNPAIGMQLMSQLNNMNQNQEEDDFPSRHHKRHHKHKKHHHKKSTTKLLLRLLVDKMKDIYELDKMTVSKNIKKIKSESSAGKIGLTLDDLAIPKGDVHHGDQNKTENDFKTKLSFPVTVSDSTIPDRLHLKSEDKTDRNSKDKNEDDTNIQKILASLQIEDGSDADNDPTKKSDKLKIDDLTESISKDIATANDIEDAKSKSEMMPVIKGQEMKTENAKSRDNIESIVQDMKNEEAGGLSEFHNVKLDKDLLPESMAGIKSDLTPEERSSLTSKTNILGFKEFSYPQVTAPEIFSVSSILNGGKDTEDSDDTTTISSKLLKSMQDFIPDATKRKTFPSNPSEVNILPLVPSDIKKGEDTLQSLTESISNDVTSKVKDGADYVKAARVLGSVFKKVKDPVAKNSIETAIKAMLQVMKYKAKEDTSGSTSKKYHFPSIADTKLLEQIQNLNKVVKQMTRRVHHKRRKKAYFNTR